MGKGKKLLWVFHHSKPLWAVFSILISLLLVVGSTYSWITESDERINQSKTNTKELSAVIKENFTANLSWSPGELTIKEVQVKNNGQVPAFVRVSLFECFAQFEMDLVDQTGNGNIKIYDSASGTNFDKSDVSTWVAGNTYQIAANQFFKLAEVSINNPSDHSQAFDYTTSRGTPFSYFEWELNDSAIYTSLPASSTINYWLYEDGYFYYSELLAPGEETELLLESITLRGDCPNQYKGAIYQVIPVMDAHDRTQSLMTDWEITSGPVYDLYQPFVV